MSSTPERALVVALDFDGRGGMERKIRRLAESLGESRDVTVVTWSGWREVGVERRSRALTVVRVPAFISWRVDHSSLPARARVACSLAAAAAAVLWLARRPCVLYAGGLAPEGIVAGLAGRVFGRPYVVDTWLPGPLGSVALLESAPSRRLFARLLMRARAYLAQTEEIAQELIGAGFDPGRVRLVPNGIPLQAASTNGAAVDRASLRRRLNLGVTGVVVYTGRFDLRQKRLDLLLQAWAQTSLHDWSLVLVGGGPDRGEVERQAQALGVRPVLVGWQEDVRPFLDAADVYVLPTNFEGTPAAMLEGMACGLPGIVSRTPGLEQLDPPGVLLVPNRPESWASALRRLAGSPDERRALGAAGRAWVSERHNWGQTASAYAALLEA